MARCHHCSAPLPANINRCTYCNVRNDVDLHSKHQYTAMSAHLSERICPLCDKALETIRLDEKESCSIERCNSCFGLFFDPGEIEMFLESSVTNVNDVNLELIKNINTDRFQKNKKVKYVKCPICRTLMNRKNFGHSSGVVIDQCKKHGMWLDSGEITHLLEWKKAGGKLLHAAEKDKAKLKKKRQTPLSGYNLPTDRQQSVSFDLLDSDLLDTVSSLVYRIFR